MAISTLQLIIVGIYTGRINQQYNDTAHKYKVLDTYSRLFGVIEQGDFQSEKLLNLKEQLGHDSSSPSVKLRKLSRIFEALEGRMNLLGTLIFNGLFLRDLHSAFRLADWQKQNGPELEHWFATVCEMDALNSLGTLYFNNPGFCFPEYNAATLMAGENMAHPLIPAAKRIANSLDIRQWGQFALITGSNMGGKSTFLRTVGINMVLASAGSPVCATCFTFTPVPIYTSMRVGDSIRNSESTFYAELQRLKRIIQELQSGNRIFILLDEILRGTNSADKLTGSFALIRQLIHLKGAGIIATHDLQLGTLENEFREQLRNYSFEVKTEGDRFIFDYKLKNGVCRTMNATQLMKSIGIDITL